MKQQISGLMQKEVTRKEFLGMGGLAVISLFGMGSLAKLFTGKSLLSSPVSRGYGGSAYGK